MPLDKKSFVWETHSESDTLHLARSLGALLRPGDWVALVGDLGTGKTVFAKGLGAAFHCEGLMRSPTFSLVQTYKSRLGKQCFPLHHVDLFRLQPNEVPLLEWEELFDNDSITVVEWAEKAKLFWPPHCLPVSISYRAHDHRVFEFQIFGHRSAEIVEGLKKIMREG